MAAQIKGGLVRYTPERSAMHRLLCRGLVPLILMTAVVLISGCTQNDASYLLQTPVATLAPLTEHLVFTGDISGTVTTGINARPLSHENPISDTTGQPARFTQCSDFNVPELGDTRDYVAVIRGAVVSQQYVVEVEINEDDPAYTKPGTKLLPGVTNTGGSVGVFEIGGNNRSWQQVYGPSSQEPAVIVLNADQKSGTVDAWMASSDLSQKDATATLHLRGDWRCG